MPIHATPPTSRSLCSSCTSPKRRRSTAGENKLRVTHVKLATSTLPRSSESHHDAVSHVLQGAVGRDHVADVVLFLHRHRNHRAAEQTADFQLAIIGNPTAFWCISLLLGANVVFAFNALFHKELRDLLRKTREIENLPISDFKSDASAVPPLGQRRHIRTDAEVVRD